MDDVQKTVEVAEPLYIIPSHPAVPAPLRMESGVPEEPVTASDSLPDLIQRAVEGMRGELKAELATELEITLQKDRGGLENVKNQELPTG